MTVRRLSQASAEVLLQAVPKVRLGQQAAELVVQGMPRARHGQQVVEVLRSVAVAGGAMGRQPAMVHCVSG